MWLSVSTYLFRQSIYVSSPPAINPNQPIHHHSIQPSIVLLPLFFIHLHLPNLPYLSHKILLHRTLSPFNLSRLSVANELQEEKFRAEAQEDRTA